MGLKVCVAVWLPDRGGVYTTFQSAARGQNASTLAGTKAITVKPYTASAPTGGFYWTGGTFHASDIQALGLVRRPGESEYAWSRRLGQGILETMRTRLGVGDGCKYSIVGGGVDMVALRQDGARIERLVDWDDPVGFPVDPFRDMSRAERRRVERMVG